MSFWQNRKVVVTGGTGFIGSHLVEMLLNENAIVTVPTRTGSGPHLSAETCKKIRILKGDLKDSGFCREVFNEQDVLMHLAAKVGGIEYNIKHPASIFVENMRVFMNCMEAARDSQLQRVLVTSSACVYPRHCAIPTPETEGFKDRPEPTNEGYGWAKRMEEFLGEAFNKEFGLSVAIARPYNCYGPRDNFDPSSSHVIPALIRRIFKEGERPLQVWGSGEQSRSFLYVDDFARGLMEVAEKYPTAQALNIGSDEETTIRELVEILSDLHLEFNGSAVAAVYDLGKPEGQPRRRCDTRLAEEKIGYHANTKLRDGLRKTISWYLSQGLP
jgi:GDP-L-fucose synthase